MNALSAIFRALRAGEELTNAATWKNRQNAASALGALLGAALLLAKTAGLKLDISPDDLAAIVGGIATIGCLLNAAITTATSAKIGLPPIAQPDPPGNQTGDSNLMDPGG